MLKAALAGKVLQKGKTPVQYKFSEAKSPQAQLQPGATPSSRADSEAASAPAVAALVAAPGSVWEEEGPAVLSPCLSPLGASAAPPQTLHPAVCRTHGQG